MTALYTARATATSGRNGHVESSDGLLSLELGYPKELGGNGLATNPEQMLQGVMRPVFPTPFCFSPSSRSRS
jgi:organic hydroperoxide reductase OsmC/OhrA